MPALPILIGSANGLTPATGATLQRNAYGIDVLSRPFTCPRSRVPGIIPAEGTADIFHRTLYATGNYSVVENEGLQCTVTVEYKGLMAGIPDPIKSRGLSTSSVSATGGDSGPPEQQRTWEILYFSPSVSYKYVASGEPTGPRFGPEIKNAAPIIVTQTIRDGNGKPRASVGNISIVPVLRNSGFKAEMVPGSKGPLYEVEETWNGYFELKPSA